MLVAHLPAKLAAKVTGWSAHQASCSPAIPALCGLDQDLPLELDLAASIFFSFHGIPLCSSPLSFTHSTIWIKCTKFQQSNGEESNQSGCSKQVQNYKLPRICLNMSCLECGKVISCFGEKNFPQCPTAHICCCISWNLPASIVYTFSANSQHNCPNL